MYLIDEDEEYYETPSDTTSRDTVKIDFNFTPNEDEDTIEVDLNPGYNSSSHSTEVRIKHDFSK